MKKRFISHLNSLVTKNSFIPPERYEELNVKRGLRHKNGIGVLVGLTKIGSVHGYIIEHNQKKVADGRLYYRGIEIKKLISQLENKRYAFEKTMFLLLFGKLPNVEELKTFSQLLYNQQTLPDEFVENFILRKPSRDIMNQLQRNVICLYTLDDNPDAIDLDNLITQALTIIAKFPSFLVYSYQATRHKYLGKSLVIRNPKKTQSISENILYMLRTNKQFTPLEAEILDLMLVVHAEHGGGNNSSFTAHVVSSTETDTYSTIAASIGSLKGPKHGGANFMVQKMVDDMEQKIDVTNRDEIREYIRGLFKKEHFDKAGVVYGMGHAIYTKSDPRAIIMKEKGRLLAQEKNLEKRFWVFEQIEALTKEVGKELKGNNFEICANVDLYSGFIYQTLNIPQELYTPLFAMSRLASWNAHRIEQLISDKKLIRPAYHAIKKNGDLQQ